MPTRRYSMSIDGRFMNSEDLDLATWPMFYKMSQRGLVASLEKLENLRTEILAKLDEQSAVIEMCAGRVINPMASADVAAWMEEQGLTGKKTKLTNRLATDERSLSEHKGNPVIDAVLEYRGLKKLQTTFVEPTMELAKKDPIKDQLAGIIHPRWRLTKVRSGRVACEDPNLLAFPSRDEMGRRVRSCFIARPGHYMVSVDFSQLEPRVVAALSEDPKLLHIYANDLDLYDEISKSLGVSRTVAKTVTLGVLYGMGPNRLVEQLKMVGAGEQYSTVEACDALINQWFVTYSGVAKYIDAVIASARKNDGWVFTKGGRGRLLPGVFVTGWRWPAEKIREEAERQAFNHVIQGTGMEQLRVAMRRVDALEKHGVYMLLAIHDELVLEVEAPDLTSATGKAMLIADTMASEFYGVKLKTSQCVGLDWGSLKS